MPGPEPQGAAQLYVFTRHALYVGPSTDAAEHRHHALQIAIGLGSPFRLKTGDEWTSLRSAVIAGNHRHQFDGRDGTQLLLLLDAEAPIARGLHRKFLHDRPVASIDEYLSSVVTADPGALLPIRDCTQAAVLCSTVFTALLGAQPAQVGDLRPQVRQVLQLIDELPIKKISVEALANGVHMSPSRLMALFREDVGVPMRRYLMWQRVRAVAALVMSGISLTDAAHRAGFADSAHLSRTFRQMFGLRMRDLFKNSPFVQVTSCADA